MQGGTTPWMGEVERSRKPEPRATQGAVADDCRDAGGRATQGAVAEQKVGAISGLGLMRRHGNPSSDWTCSDRDPRCGRHMHFRCPSTLNFLLVRSRFTALNDELLTGLQVASAGQSIPFPELGHGDVELARDSPQGVAGLDLIMDDIGGRRGLRLGAG